MSEKIQTEFAKRIVEESRKLSKREIKSVRPKNCTAPKKCIALHKGGDEQLGYICTGIWQSKDEDIIRLCTQNGEGKRDKTWMTPLEAQMMAQALNYAVFYSILEGIPDLREIMENFHKHKAKN